MLDAWASFPSRLGPRSSELFAPVSAPAALGEAVYLILSMGADKMLRFKPQNLITGLPIRQLESAS